MQTETRRELRMSTQNVASWLARLDTAAQTPTGLDQRLSPRFEYRPQALTLEIMQGDLTVPHAVAGRNLSSGGLGALAGQFIYPQSTCRVELTSPFGQSQVVDGRVARCRYLLGSGCLHEVGVEFDRPIDIAVFAPQARRVHVLLCGADAATQALMAGFLHAENADLVSVDNPADAADALSVNKADLVLIDLDAAHAEGFDTIRHLRESGYVGPVLGMTAQVTPELQQQGAVAGCTGYLTKPILRSRLRGLVAALTDQPLVSTLASDSALAPLVDQFVAELGEKVSALARARQTGDTETLTALVQYLRAHAGSYGFEEISEEASVTQALLAGGAPAGEVDAAVDRLIDLCLRARPATSPAD